MTRSIKLRLITAVALTLGMLAPLLGPAVTPASAVSDVQTERIGGVDRFETAANVARAGHPAASTAIIANGLAFPDALSGSTLAGALDAPILLVAPRSIPAVTSRALTDLGVNDVVIVGGPAAVSTEVENQLRQNYGVTRVFGADRYKTAVEIARRAAVGGVGTVDGVRTAFISTGLNFPDALGAGPLAYEGNLPNLLTRPNELPPEVAQLIRDLNIEHVVILGGTQAVSGSVEAQLEAIGVTTERLNGRNRAETATFVADFALNRMGFEGQNVILARGDNFPDALAGGPLGGERRAVILLTATPCQLAIETRDWLEEHFGTVTRITALGGQSAVCDAVLREAEQAAETNNLPPDRVDLTISGGSMNGGPEWQYQESDASPSKSLTLSAFVSSDPSEGSDPDATRTPAGREDVVFNIRPSEGDPEGNTELNLTARTGTNGIATVTYTRANPGTDIITVRLRDDTSITDDGVGRWDTSSMPLSLTPDEPQSLDVGQTRSFTVCVPGPTGSPTTTPTTVNLTTLELVDDDPNNDTNVPALRFGTGVTDDRGDTDQTIATVSTEPGTGCRTFTVSSNAAQIFTLMAFRDTVTEPAANDDNTNPPEYRDIAGVTTFGGTQPGLNVSPPNDGTTISRRNGEQIVYTVTSVDAQGQPLTSPVDVSFEQLTDNQPGTTTTAEFDWYDNSATPSTQAMSENQVPPGATGTGNGTRRIQVVPNSQGVFTFAITNSQLNRFGTSGTPIAWIDLPGGVDNRPDPSEPQARGRNFSFGTGSVTQQTSSLESLGCPPGVPERGSAGNPLTIPDPCLGRDVLASAPHVPWEVPVAAPTGGLTSTGINASTCLPGPTPTLFTDDETEPNAAAISRGDLVQRFTFRDETGTPLPPGAFADGLEPGTVTFRVQNTSILNRIHIAPNRPNPGCSTTVEIAPQSSAEMTISTTDAYAELVVDGGDGASALVQIVATSSDSVLVCDPDPTVTEPCELEQHIGWTASIDIDTTAGTEVTPTNGSTNCPSPLQPCLNGTLLAIDKARDYYVMTTGGTAGQPGDPTGTSQEAYVVYAVGGGSRITTDDAGNVTGTPDRPFQPPRGTDEYFIDGLPAPPEPSDDRRCGYWAVNIVDPGCARFDFDLSYDDIMVFEQGPMKVRTGTTGIPGTRDQTHFLTNGTSPVPQ